MSEHEFAHSSERIEELVARIENCGDQAARAVAKELLQAVLDLHTGALEKIVDAVEALPDADVVLCAMAEDPVVSGVLALHGLHPVPVEARVAEALEKTRPYLKSHGGDVELTSVDRGVVRVRLQGACAGARGAEETLQHTVETAIYDAAPEVAAIVPEHGPVRPHSNVVVIGGERPVE